ncbi:MAG TPA: LysR family transcriptional regulator [Mesorhizobium sp.]|jgi:DNA-binding transcriptional LysR family regulator|nr:LysR family transcriptional regulator [Mesorhizobium sp.]
MQLDHIRTFLDLVESRNFNRSADRLGVTQSTVSSRIRSLEEEIGSALFHRGRAGAEPTAAGRRFEPYARSMLLTWSQARHDVRAFNRFEGSLRVAAQVGMTGALLPLWAEALGRTLPRSSIHVESDYSPQMISDLSLGNLDMAVLYAPRFLPEIAYEPLMIEDYLMVSASARELNEVHADAYIRPGYTVVIEKAHSETLPELALSRLSTGSVEFAEAMLRRGGGTCYLRSDDARRLASDKGPFLVRGAPVLQQPVHLAVIARRRRDPLIRKATQALQSAVRLLTGARDAAAGFSKLGTEPPQAL